MGCKSNFTRQGTPCYQSNHCDIFVPTSADQKVTTEFTEYPESPIRNSNINYQIEKRDSIAVMYPSFGVTLTDGSPPSAGGTCGKVFRTVNCSGVDRYYYDYVPNELSFDLGFSDRYFAYLYDTSDNAGHAGIACYYLQDETRASTTASPGNDPVTGDPIPGTTTTTGGVVCKPCTSFSCATSKTNISYSGTEDLTGDPDAPIPTLFGVGTDSNKVVFSYDSLSSTLPNGVTDIEFSYDGVTYTDVWDEDALTGIPYDSTQNPFVTGQDQFNDFQIYDLNSGNATGFRVKIALSSIADVDAEPGPTYSGVQWQITELLSPGTGYSTGTVFPLTYAYTKTDGTVVNLTMNLKISGVGPVDIVEGQSGFDVLRAGDTINNHEITRVFHTDIDNFPYHIAYVDGNGSNFAKDTQYTSNRNHVITAKAGYGIADRACLVGIYEFTDKSVQFTTLDINKNAPDVYNTLVQPQITLTVTNGAVTNATISDGGSGWNTLGRDPVLSVAGPQGEGGVLAVLEPTFTNGVLTAVQIVNQGSKYDASNPPQAYISNTSYALTDSRDNPRYNPEKTEDIIDTFDQFPGLLTEEDRKYIRDAYEADPKMVKELPTPNATVKLDNERLRFEKLPQKLFSKKAVDEWRETSEFKVDLTKDIAELDIDESIKVEILQSHLDDVQLRKDFADAMTQEQIPEQYVAKSSLVETVRGTFNDLPQASTYTKYLITQVRTDNASDTTIRVTLSCEVAQKGCAHVPCSPTASVGGTTTDSDGNTIVTSYSALTGPLGGGCRDWSASGDLIIQNDMTATTNTIKDAISRYGNPYEVT